MTPTPPPADRPWHEDPLEIDRLLDGEVAADERASREAQMAADADLARRVVSRRALLARLTASAPAWNVAAAQAMPPGLEDRVRTTLASASRARRPRLWAYAAAAVVLLALGLVFLPEQDPQGRGAEAAPPAVLAAREALAIGNPRAGGCPEGGPTSPFAFPPVREGELDVVGCNGAGDRPGLQPAVLQGQEQIIGFVAVPEPGTRESPKVGKTVLGDAVVYDVQYGDTRAYLAVPKSFVAKRGDCAACHNTSRDGQKNPHYIELRRWVVK